jgi:hypothetical protein
LKQDGCLLKRHALVKSKLLCISKSQGLEEDNNKDDSDSDIEEEADVTNDTFHDVDGPNATEAEDESNKTRGQNSVSWATNLVRPATCSTCLAAKAGRVLDKSRASVLNAKQTCELACLSGTFYLAAGDILDKSKRQEQQFSEQMPDNNI